MTFFIARSLRNWLLLIAVLIGFLLEDNHYVVASRSRLGCHAAKPLTCDKPLDSEYTTDMAAVCKTLEDEIFPSSFTNKDYFDESKRVKYIDQKVSASSALCGQIRAAYPYCWFCGSDLEYMEECLLPLFLPVVCGARPPMEVMLQDNNNEKYEAFRSQADILATCRDFETINTLIVFNETVLPLELCKRYISIRHLCPGECDGTCFDAEQYLPTCNLYRNNNQSSSLLMDEEPIFYETPGTNSSCDALVQQAFSHGVELDVFLNVSKHLAYLGAVHENEEYSCEDYRQIYPRCIWCASSTDWCFDTANPPSCDPAHGKEGTEHPDATEVCRALESSFYFEHIVNEGGYYDIYNASFHLKYFLFPKSDPLCDHARQVFHECHWCAKDVAPGYCDLSSEQGPCYNKEFLVPDYIEPDMRANHTFDGELNCKDILDEYFYYAGLATIKSCYQLHVAVRLCPNEFEKFCLKHIPGDAGLVYLGATTSSQRKALIWMCRAAAILSFFGASFILWDILPNTSARKTVYHQLLIGMATFDIVTAVAWLFATAPIAEGSYVEGSVGTEATCKAQAFFVQLGFGSVFYNVSLCIYYVLVIVFSWREFELKRICPYLHVFPLLLAFGLAFGGIPSYQFMQYACHLMPPPDGPLWPVLVFVVVPLGCSIFIISAAMLFVYCKVRQQAASTRKWMFGVGQTSQMEQAVFWQCFFYCRAFYITWPLMFSVYLASVDSEGPLGLALAVAFFAPLQGFSNFLVFVRPKLQNRRNRSPQRREDNSTQQGSTGWTSARRFKFIPTFGRANSSREESDSHEEDTFLRHTDPSAALPIQREMSIRRNDINVNGGENDKSAGEVVVPAENPSKPVLDMISEEPSQPCESQSELLKPNSENKMSVTHWQGFDRQILSSERSPP